MRSERGGLAQTPRQLRLVAACMLAVAVAYGVFAGAGGRPLLWGFVAVFSGWSIHLLRLAARWTKEDIETPDDRSPTS